MCDCSASSAGFSLIRRLPATSQPETNLMAVLTHIKDAYKAAASVLSINLQLLHADRLFLMTLLLAFMIAGHKELTVGCLQPCSISYYLQRNNKVGECISKATYAACMSAAHKHSRALSLD